MRLHPISNYECRNVGSISGFGLVEQLECSPPCHGGGRQFESGQDRDMVDEKVEARKQAQARYRAKNREARKEYDKKRRRQLKSDALSQYGTSCSVCGFDDIRALQIDHIADNGNVERMSLGGQNFSGWRFYEYLKKMDWPEGYQTLCANHNMIKHLGEDFDT